MSSSIVTAAFNKMLLIHYPWGDKDDEEKPIACFDSRVFPIVNMVEAVNCLVWRQRDCTKNSINSACYYEVARHEGRGTTRKMMHELDQNERQELLFKKTGINWNDYPAEFKRGIVVFREPTIVTTEYGTAERKKWVFKAAPIFTSEDGRAWLNIVLSPPKEEQDGQEKKIQQGQTGKTSE